jgi:hypothetical protein
MPLGATQRIGLLPGSGDVPGSKAVVCAIEKIALPIYRSEKLDIEAAFQSLLWPRKFQVLELHEVRFILPHTGTISGIANHANSFQDEIQTRHDIHAFCETHCLARCSKSHNML